MSMSMLTFGISDLFFVFLSLNSFLSTTDPRISSLFMRRKKWNRESSWVFQIWIKPHVNCFLCNFGEHRKSIRRSRSNLISSESSALSAPVWSIIKQALWLIVSPTMNALISTDSYLGTKTGNKYNAQKLEGDILYFICPILIFRDLGYTNTK